MFSVLGHLLYGQLKVIQLLLLLLFFTVAWCTPGGVGVGYCGTSRTLLALLVGQINQSPRDFLSDVFLSGGGWDIFPLVSSVHLLTCQNCLRALEQSRESILVSLESQVQTLVWSASSVEAICSRRRMSNNVIGSTCHVTSCFEFRDDGLFWAVEEMEHLIDV